jgi:hypothetical protein
VALNMLRKVIMLADLAKDGFVVFDTDPRT